jgi:hypothetical protein
MKFDDWWDTKDFRDKYYGDGCFYTDLYDVAEQAFNSRQAEIDDMTREYETCHAEYKAACEEITELKEKLKNFEGGMYRCKPHDYWAGLEFENRKLKGKIEKALKLLHASEYWDEEQGASYGYQVEDAIELLEE